MVEQSLLLRFIRRMFTKNETRALLEISIFYSKILNYDFYLMIEMHLN